MNDIQTLLAKDKIKTQLSLYCKGVDQRDWDLVRSCFGDNHQHQHGAFEGSLDEFIGFASRSLSKIKISQHSLSNLMVTFSDDGLSAQSEVYFTAFHSIEGSAEWSVFEIHGQDTDWIVAGCYEDRWVCVDDDWLIVKRNARHNWERIEPSKGR